MRSSCVCVDALEEAHNCDSGRVNEGHTGIPLRSRGMVWVKAALLACAVFQYNKRSNLKRRWGVVVRRLTWCSTMRPATR